MIIRQATVKDSGPLQELQARCPQGTALVVRTVNVPDFFSRARAYVRSEVFVAEDESGIKGSGACAIREARISGQVVKVGYLFQAFVDPSCRREGVASRLLEERERFLAQNDAVMAYCIIIGGNIPSMRYAESRGYRLGRTLLMPGMAAYKAMHVEAGQNIRTATSDDYEQVAELVNSTWQGSDLLEPMSAWSLSEYIRRVPGMEPEQMVALEENGLIRACVGYLDWQKFMSLTVESLGPKLRLISLFLRGGGLFFQLPDPIVPGTVLRQAMLTAIGFRDVESLAQLMKHLNNEMLRRGTDLFYCTCDREHELLRSLKGHFRVDTRLSLYVKELGSGFRFPDGPVFVDGIDL